MFILGSVGIGMFSSVKMGYIILFSHIVGSVINGVIYRCKKNNFEHIHNGINPEKISFSDSINGSVSSILLIGGVVCFSFVLIDVIISSNGFLFILNFLSKIGLNQKLLTAIFSGFFEITKGCLLLSSCGVSTQISTAVCCFIISFGGISTILQSTAFTKEIISVKKFMLQKFTHAIFATFVSLILIVIL